MAVPVIATDARGNRELVEGSGLVVPVGDVPGLTAGMSRLADEPVFAADLGRQGRARMVATYDINVLLDRHLELYAALLAERRARSAGPNGD